MLIEQPKQNSQNKPFTVIFIIIAFSIPFSLNPSSLINKALLLLVAIVLIAVSFRIKLVNSKKRIFIDKNTQNLYVNEVSFWGREIKNLYPLSLFDSIQSYITRTSSSSSDHVIELLTKDTCRGLILVSFGTTKGSTFWTSHTEHANPKAVELATEIANFLTIKDLGFVGHRLATNQI